MTKYNQSFKQEVIAFFLQNGKNCSLTRQQFQLKASTLRRWISQYNYNGINSLAVLGKRQKYSPEFKLTVIQAVKKGQFSAESACLHFGIANSGVISQWLQAFEKIRYKRLISKAERTTSNETEIPENASPTQNRRRTLALSDFGTGSGECLPKKVAGTQPSKNAEKVAIMKMLRVNFSLEILLYLTGLKRCSFFYHLQLKIDKNVAIRQEIVEIYRKNDGNYGYRRITLALRKMFGAINHKRVQAIMQQLDLKGKCKQRKYRSYKGEVGKIAENLLRQDFHTNALNEKLVTDITEFKCAEGKLYLSPIKDLFNGEIIAYDLARSPNFEQIMRMMKQAVAKLPQGASLILHSDQGWQYQMAGYQAILKQNGIVQSMSRKGNCLDNSAMESFFGRLKTECYFGKRFETFEQLEQTIQKYIHYYNHERIQVRLKGLSPVQYRTQSLN